MTPHTKRSIEAALETKARSLGGDFQRISGDCYAGVVAGELRLAVALKESGASRKRWVGVPGPLWKLLIGEYSLPGITATQDPKRFRIALIHKPNNTVLSISLIDVFRAVFQRANANRRDVEWSFDVHKTGFREYVVKRDSLQKPLPVSELGLDPLERLLE